MMEDDQLDKELAELEKEVGDAAGIFANDPTLQLQLIKEANKEKEASTTFQKIPIDYRVYYDGIDREFK